MPAFFFPILFLRPTDEFSSAAKGPFHLARRRWETTTFDLATLATKHRLRLPYQLMDVLLARCNLELQIDAPDIETARDSLSAVMFGMYLSGVSPTIAPFATSHSINDYSGINSRDSELLRVQLPLELQQGLTSDEATVDAWPVNLSLQCKTNIAASVVAESQFLDAATKAGDWLKLESRDRSLRVVRDAAQAAPTLMPLAQGLLHVWSALEALFPRVNTEVSFRVGLYLAQLASLDGKRLECFERVRRAYGLRSRIAHGADTKVTDEDWLESWTILLDASNAVLQRGGLPTEEQLLKELLTR